MRKLYAVFSAAERRFAGEKYFVLLGGGERVMEGLMIGDSAISLMALLLLPLNATSKHVPVPGSRSAMIAVVRGPYTPRIAATWFSGCWLRAVVPVHIPMMVPTVQLLPMMELPSSGSNAIVYFCSPSSTEFTAFSIGSSSLLAVATHAHAAMAERMCCSARTSTFSWLSPKVLDVPADETWEWRRVELIVDMADKRAGRRVCWRDLRVGGREREERWAERVGGLDGEDILVIVE